MTGSGVLWGIKGKKTGFEETEAQGQFFRSTIVDIATRLRVARGIGKTETDASIEAFETLQQRGYPDVPPPLVSDGWGGIREALVETYGKVPEYGGRGRPPTRKRPQPGWKYLQVIKQPRKTGGAPRLKVVFGDEETVLAELAHHTAYVERTHLTMRQFDSRITRNGLGFSKDLDMYTYAAALEDVVYNLARPLKSLRVRINDDSPRRWEPRTPAMAAGLTDHVWTIKEMLKIRIVFTNS